MLRLRDFCLGCNVKSGNLKPDRVSGGLRVKVYCKALIKTLKPKILNPKSQILNLNVLHLSVYYHITHISQNPLKSS